MTTLTELSANVLALRAEIDTLLAKEDYIVEELAEKAVTLNSLLNTKPSDILDGEVYRLFLTDHLQWLNAVIGRISEEKQAIASSILQTQRRKKAEKSYGENQ
ncbi:MAG: hypothetical protein LPK11_11555 [Chromatiaceae bacterium]|nr:hypothetical protein [Chromatiaceae bacterium]